MYERVFKKGANLIWGRRESERGRVGKGRASLLKALYVQEGCRRGASVWHMRNFRESALKHSSVIPGNRSALVGVSTDLHWWVCQQICIGGCGNSYARSEKNCPD